MKANELHTKDVGELRQELDSLLKAQFGYVCKKATQQLSNNSQIQKVRRDIARVRTILTQKAGSLKKNDRYANNDCQASTQASWKSR